MYKLRDLQEHSVSAEINGKWIPARPLQYRSFMEKLKEAWAVFIGKADAFMWPEDQ